MKMPPNPQRGNKFVYLFLIYIARKNYLGSFLPSFGEVGGGFLGYQINADKYQHR